jgi:hypothetical protein
VIANATHTAVVIPCGSRATICAKHGYSSGGEAALNDGRILTLDDVPIKRESTISKGMSYLCVVNVGCGVSGGFRTGTVV